MSKLKYTQHIGYVSVILGSAFIIYNLATDDSSQLIGFAGFICIMFGVFKLTKRIETLEEERHNTERENEDR